MKVGTLLLLSLLLLSLAAMSLPGVEVGAADFDHSPWDRVLKRFVTEESRVDYSSLKVDSNNLDGYVEQLAARSPVSHPSDFPTRESQLAYWINAYNAFTMTSVIEHWPTKSVRDIGFLPYSFFWRQKFTAGGKRYTLNNIENDYLRKQLQEPRIHFVIVCASNSCPRLQREAFTEENTERLLEAAARFFVNEPRNLQIDRDANRVTVARVFTFFDDDFKDYAVKAGNSPTGYPLLDYIWIYANEENRAALESLDRPRVRDFEYDWGINDVNAPVSTGANARN